MDFVVVSQTMLLFVKSKFAVLSLAAVLAEEKIKCPFLQFLQQHIIERIYCLNYIILYVNRVVKILNG
jgi:hypothetical protein